MTVIKNHLRGVKDDCNVSGYILHILKIGQEK